MYCKANKVLSPFEAYYYHFMGSVSRLPSIVDAFAN